MYYVILVIVGIIIGVPILKSLLKSGNNIFVFAGIIWGVLSLFPYFGIHELVMVPFWWKVITFPAWVVISVLNFITYNLNFFFHDFISSNPRLLRDVLVEILNPVLTFIGSPLFGGFIILILFKLGRKMLLYKSSTRT